MTTRHAFVTGGTGFLGLNLIEQLIGQGWQVTALHPAHILGRYDRRGWARLIIAAHERWLPGVPSGAGTFCHAEAVGRAQIAAVKRGRTGQNYLMSGADASSAQTHSPNSPVIAAPRRASRSLFGSRIRSRQPELNLLNAPVHQLFRAINEVTGARVPLRPLPPFLFRLAAHVATARAAVTGREPEATPEGVAIATARARVGSDLAERELGYQPSALHTTVEDSWTWLRQANLVPSAQDDARA